MRNTILATALLCLGWSAATTVTTARTLLERGDVPGALLEALALNTSEGYALAARAAALRASITPSPQREELYRQAVEYARRAIELNPGNADAHYEFARAYGRLAQGKGMLEALGMAGDVRGALNRAIALNPRHAAAYAGLGIWNTEAPLVAGGNAAEVQPNFEKAIQLDPQSITHRLDYANALLKVNRRNKPSAIAVLERAVLLTPRSYWELLALESARRLLAELKR